jgi:hypothetical protein
VAGVAAPKSDERDLIRRYVRGDGVNVTDHLFAKALFLRSHPGWSPADYDSAEQDVIDIIDALDLAAAQRTREANLQQQREAAAAAHRARIGAN